MKVLVTGTSRGIGRAIADYFLDRGHEVIGIDRNEKALSMLHILTMYVTCVIRENCPSLMALRYL